jgi:GH35 family endo-1,4-beta-xylanase
MYAFLWWNHEAAERDLNLIDEAGFSWVKQNLGWRDVEGAAKGAYNWYFPDWIVEHAAARGLKILFRLDHQPLWVGDFSNGPPENLQDMADFCSAVATRYRGRVHAYQVWNEPNLAREWAGRSPNPIEYVQLLKVCYTALKKVDPNALVITAGLAPTGSAPPAAMPDIDFLTGMYEAGAQPYFDLLGIHAAGFKAPPELSPDDAETDPAYGSQRFFSFRHVEDAREVMLRYGDADKQIAITEFGWTTDQRADSSYSWHAVSEEQQADYLVRAFHYARDHWKPWIGPMFVAFVADPAWEPQDEQYWWAITEPDPVAVRTRPAYEALRAMEK